MLTPQDVRSVQFEKNLRGYRTEDVDRFLDRVEEQLKQDDTLAADRGSDGGEPASPQRDGEL